jgi:outer membrane lipoprotein SlyB
VYVQSPVRVAQAQPAPNPALHGEVRGIEAIRERPQGTGKGAIIGGVLGAVVGNRFGHGNGRAAMTVLGGAGGAVAGNNVERNMNEGVVGYRVVVRLDNGQQRTYEEPRLDGLQIGDRIRVDHGHIRRA